MEQAAKWVTKLERQVGPDRAPYTDLCWLKTQHSKNKDHGIWSHHFMANRWGNNGNSDRLYFGGVPKSLQMVIATMKLKDTSSLEEKL